MALPSKYIKNPITIQNLHYKQLSLSPTFSHLDFCNTLLTGLARLWPLSIYRLCILNTDLHSDSAKTQLIMKRSFSKLSTASPSRSGSKSKADVIWPHFLSDLIFYYELQLRFSHTGLLAFPWTLEHNPSSGIFVLAVPSAWNMFSRYLHDLLPYFHQIFIQTWSL